MNGFYWLASYPKSGNTWLRLFLASLAKGGASVDINNMEADTRFGYARFPFDHFLDIESTDLTVSEITNYRPRIYEIEAASANKPLFCKVHDAYHITPKGEPLFPPAVTLGVVYLVRDPRDVAVSYASHSGYSIDKSISVMANLQTMLCDEKRNQTKHIPQILYSWSGHVKSWLDAPGIRRLVLRYEDMVANPVDCFGEAARFLGMDAPPSMVAAAVKAVRFETLSAAEDANGFVERPNTVTKFFRRGVAGGWRDTLTSEQAARIESDHGPVMRLLGYLP